MSEEEYEGLVIIMRAVNAFMMGLVFVACVALALST